MDWRVCDRWKRPLISRWDFVLDTNNRSEPKLAEGEAVRRGLSHAVTRPFRVVPFFDPAPWGGQWMKEVCGLNSDAPNYGWCFDCVPEENSLLFGFGGVRLEIPSIDLVFDQPRALLGEGVYARFGAEFPIRFDFLDTMGGGNLSFQVHPLTEYFRRTFGMAYTQDESYYMLEAGPDASVYLGLRTGVEPAAMLRDLEAAQSGKGAFEPERYANRWPAKKHDHFLIPAGRSTAPAPMRWCSKSVLRPTYSHSSCGTGAGWAWTANRGPSISATASRSFNGTAIPNGPGAGWSTGFNPSPEARVGAKSAPDCTSWNSSRHVVIGLPGQCRTTPGAA